MPIREFIDGVRIHGLPLWYVSSEYGKDDIPFLMSVIGDADETFASRKNALQVLGMLADSDASETVIGFIDARYESNESNEDRFEANRRRLGNISLVDSALLALGFLCNRTGSQRALDFLIKRSDPGSWGPPPLSGMSREYMLPPTLSALAFTGRPEARELILSKLRRIESGDMSAAGRWIGSGKLKTMLKSHSEIAERGLEAYSRSRHTAD